MRDAWLEQGTTASVAWSATNEPPHLPIDPPEKKMDTFPGGAKLFKDLNNSEFSILIVAFEHVAGPQKFLLLPAP